MNEVREKSFIKRLVKGFNTGEQIGESSFSGKIFNIFCRKQEEKQST